MIADMDMREAFGRYRTQISILKKGYAQEKYRIDQICRSFLGELLTREVSSVDIATYRDIRLKQTNPRTGQPLAPSTVRLELALLSNYITGQGALRFIGQGFYDSTTGRFTGLTTCDPRNWAPGSWGNFCGAGAYFNCGSDPACTYSKGSTYANLNGPYGTAEVFATNILVNNVANF